MRADGALGHLPAGGAVPRPTRPDWVKPHTFWHDLGAMLDFNPQLGAADTAIGEQARALVALHRRNEHYRPILDRVALSAYAALHDAATYAQAGLEAGNGWRRQPSAGLWGSDWYGRAIAAVIYIFVNDYTKRLPDPRHRQPRPAPQRPRSLHDDLRGERAAAGGSQPGRFLVSDHVQQGHFHDRRLAPTSAFSTTPISSPCHPGRTLNRTHRLGPGAAKLTAPRPR